MENSLIYMLYTVILMGLTIDENKEFLSIDLPWHVMHGENIQEFEIKDKVEKIDGGINLCSTIENISNRTIYIDNIAAGINIRNQFLSFTFDLENQRILKKDTKAMTAMPPPQISKLQYDNDYSAKNYIVEVKPYDKIVYCKSIALLDKNKSFYVITKFVPKIFDKKDDAFVERTIKDMRSLSNINIINY